MECEVNCECGRYLFTANSTTIIEKMPCPNSKHKALINLKIVNSFSPIEDIKHKFPVAVEE